MRIVFNVKHVGLGNNGGSRTLIKSAEILQGLKNKVIIVTDTNHYNWHKIQVPVKNYVGQGWRKLVRKCDIMVATGYASVRTTRQVQKNKAFYYIRGFERWCASKKDLIKSYKSLNCIVNSEQLKKYLKKKGIQSELIYPGLYFDDFYSTGNDRGNIIWGIYSKRHKTKRHKDVIEIGKQLGYKVLLLNRDIVNAHSDQLREFYNKIKVWVSSSELEGLHNCPHEAALCGCSLVVTDHKWGGVQDYATEETALIYPAGDLDRAAQQVKRAMNDADLRNRLNSKMQDLLKNKVGSREDNMKKMMQIFQGGQCA